MCVCILYNRQSAAMISIIHRGLFHRPLISARRVTILSLIVVFAFPDTMQIINL